MFSDLIDKHRIARAEIDSWRGRLIDYFARGETAVAQTLVCAADNGRKINLRHFAGQRLDDLMALAKTEPGTDRQNAAFTSALDAWRLLEARRVFLAHGNVSEWLDQRGNWAAIFDVRIYKSGVVQHERWAATKSDADAFEAAAIAGFKSMSGQLGVFRTRMKASAAK